MSSPSFKKLPTNLLRIFVFNFSMITTSWVLASQFASPPPTPPYVGRLEDQAIIQEQCFRKPLSKFIGYPIELLGSGIEGEVGVRVTFNKCGEVKLASVAKSSNNKYLDNSVLQYVKGWVIDVDEAEFGDDRGGVGLITAEMFDAEPYDPACINMKLDPKPFEYPTIEAAKEELKKGKNRTAYHSSSFGVMKTSYKSISGYKLLEYLEFQDVSQFGHAMILLKPKPTLFGKVDLMVSSRCEATEAKCREFDNFVQNVELMKKYGKCQS